MDSADSTFSCLSSSSDATTSPPALGRGFTFAPCSVLFPPQTDDTPSDNSDMPKLKQVTAPRDHTGSCCQVCQDSALIRHFGVICCNACGAFFRRTIAGGRTYVCARIKLCKIRFDIQRRLCRACRLAKCFHVGMRKEEVQSAYRSSPATPPTPVSETTSTAPLPYVDWISNCEFNQLSTVMDPSSLNPQNSLFPCDLGVLLNWIYRQEQQLSNYLDYFKICMPAAPLLRESLLGVWCICRLAQSTMEAGSQINNVFCFDKNTFLHLSESRIRELMFLFQTTPADRFVLSFMMGSLNAIMDFTKLTASCSLTVSDWALITHCAVLAEMLQSSPLHLALHYAAQLSKLRSELQIHYSTTKNDAVNALIDVLLSLRGTMANSIQALKLCWRRDIFDVDPEKNLFITHF